MTEVVTLLKRFKGDAAKTRSEVRMEWGITGQYLSFSPMKITITCPSFSY